MDNHSPSPQRTSNVPNGFSLIEGRGNNKVLVPTYLVPSTKLALEIEDEKERQYVDGGEAGVSVTIIASKSYQMKFHSRGLQKNLRIKELQRGW